MIEVAMRLKNLKSFHIIIMQTMQLFIKLKNTTS